MAIVETELKNLREDINQLTSSHKDFKKFCYRSFDKLVTDISRLETDVAEMSARFDSFEQFLGALNPTLSGKEKAAIIIALISGISSIVATSLQVLPQIF